MTEQRENQAPVEASGTATPEPRSAADGGRHQSRDAGGLQPAAESIAQSASSVAEILTAGHRPTTIQKVWRYTRSTVLYVSMLGGGAFALEQYLASQHQAAQVRVEGLLSAASDALGGPDHIPQANAVRTLERISEFSTYTVPAGVASIGRHLRAGLFGYSPEYPYFDQSWLIMRDFATSRSPSVNSLVPSEILRQCALWERRTRQGIGVPPSQTRGSLLFQAQLAGATGNDLDLRGIQFGAANLEGASLSGSDCSGCGLLGARLAGAKLRGTVFDSAYLAEATMNEADLSFARLNGAVLRRASLEEATFLQTDLTGSDLTAAKLNGSLFNQANLSHTNFTSSSLRDVRFVQSDVSTATFHNADVAGADFTHAFGFSQSLLRTARNSAQALVPQSPGGPK